MSFKEKLIRVFFPKRCILCGEIVPIEKQYCECQGSGYQYVGEDFCRHCGLDNFKCTCEIEKSIKIEHITAPFYYSGYAKIRLLEYKFSKDLSHADFFASKMSVRFAEVFSDVKPDFITFVPMLEQERKQRGFNQSEYLAAKIAKQLFVPKKDVLVKKRKTDYQHKLTMQQRYVNVSDAFGVSDSRAVCGKTVILCDDIKTTGSTLRACLDALYSAGAKDVYCLCAAVSPFEPDREFT